MSNEKDPNTFEVSVHDSVGVREVGPGGPVPKEPATQEKTDEELQAEREEAIRKVLERKVELADKYVQPHTVVSRRVKEEDLPRLLQDAKIMHEMCLVGHGEYNTAFAIAHSQIEDKEPLRFFVTIKGEIYINPVITAHGHELQQVQEGCMSHPSEPMKTVTRFKKVTAKFRTIAHKVNPQTGESLGAHYLSREVTREFDGAMAQILQHECQHLNGWDIYMDGVSALKALNETR